MPDVLQETNVKDRKNEDRRRSERGFTMIEILYYLSLAQLWNLLAGYAGLVSVGQQGFVGVGAYATFIFAERNGIDPWVSLLLAGLFVAALSVPVALFAFRLEGGYFAIGTWVVTRLVASVSHTKHITLVFAPSSACSHSV